MGVARRRIWIAAAAIGVVMLHASSERFFLTADGVTYTYIPIGAGGAAGTPVVATVDCNQ